jgi:tetratricopeptide (TPR) repeat protein
VCLAAALVAAAGPLAADEPLPPETVVSTGAPPLVPDGGRDRLSGWVDACVASGRRQAGTRLGGDLLYSAGVVLARRLDEPDRALAVLGEAAAAYPADAPYRGLVLLAAADLRLAGGDAVAARRVLDAAEAAARRPPPVDADVVTLSRRDLLARRMATLGADLGVRIDEAAGDLAGAAARQARLAEGLDRRGAPGADQAWARAARFHARTGDRAGALAAVDRALELTDRDETRARLSFWRLHARHGLLDADGAPTLGAHWPGDAFVEEVHVTLRGLQGNPAVGTWLLALASRAVTAGRDDAALGLYQLALGDPVLVDRARDNPLLRGGLLVAFPVALRLGRLDEAERILDVVAGIAGSPREDLDAYRVALARAREEAAREDVPTPATAPEDAAATAGPEAPPSPHRGRLYPHGPPAAADGAPPETLDGADEVGPWSVPAWPVAALCGLAALALFTTLAMRRRRRRASLGGHPSRR